MASEPTILTPEDYLAADKVTIIHPFAKTVQERSVNGKLVDAQGIYLEPNFDPNYVTTDDFGLIDNSISPT